MTVPAPILEIRNLTFGFGGNLVTDHVSMSVDRGEFVSIIGPNGAGKTTFFNVVSGVYKPSGGTIMYQAKDITGINAAQRARAGIARSFQLANLFPTLSALENARLAAQAQGSRRYGLLRPYTAYRRYLDRAHSALELVGLGARMHVPAGALSHGDKRKLELAIVIAANPEILLLDEPTSGVSAEDVPAMVALIRKIRQVEGKTVLMVEHKMSVVLDLSDRIAVLHGGKLLAIDTPEQIQRNETVQAAYLGQDSV